MTIISFPRRTPSPKAVTDFKRVCDDVGLELWDDEVNAALDRLQAALDPHLPKPPGPLREDEYMRRRQSGRYAREGLVTITNSADGDDLKQA